MDDRIELTARLQRVALQRLESLYRAGVAQLPRSQLPLSSPVLDTLQPPAPANVAVTPLSPPPSPEPAMAKQTGSNSKVQESTVQESTVQESTVQESTVQESTVQESTVQESAVHKSAAHESALAQMRREVAVCRRCEQLACTRTQTVFGVGTSKPRLCFFGEAPGAEEDRTGEPFVGRAGQLLTDIIEKGMNLRRSDVYILNVLKCRPPDNRAPTDVEIANCREYFERQFELLQPEFICCLGATATKALLNSTQSLGRMRGKWFDYRGARVIITYHPSYLLRNPPAKKDTWEDIQMLMREMGLPIEKN